MSLVGKSAINFSAKAVMQDNSIDSDFNLKNYARDSKCVLFFYPLDFTFVCPSEIIAFNNKLDEFKKRNTKVVGISVDSHFCHIAWKKTRYSDGGIESIQFPLISDLNKEISRSYDVLLEQEGIALRGTFIIDTNFVVRHVTVNDLPLGRSVEESIRIIDAIDHHTHYGEVCPAGWNVGKDAIRPTVDGVSEYLSKNNSDL